MLSCKFTSSKFLSYDLSSELGASFDSSAITTVPEAALRSCVLEMLLDPFFKPFPTRRRLTSVFN